jgi:predicted DNA-binding antitoxin AbrB/MazE fold protein
MFEVEYLFQTKGTGGSYKTKKRYKSDELHQCMKKYNNLNLREGHKKRIVIHTVIMRDVIPRSVQKHLEEFNERIQSTANAD